MSSGRFASAAHVSMGLCFGQHFSPACRIGSQHSNGIG